MSDSLTFNLETNFTNYLSSSINNLPDGYTFTNAINNESMQYPLVVSKVVNLSELPEFPWSGKFNVSMQFAVTTNARNSGSLAAHDYMIESVRGALSDPAAVRSFTNTTSSGCFIYSLVSMPTSPSIKAENLWVYVADYEVFAQQEYDGSAVIYD